MSQLFLTTDFTDGCYVIAFIVPMLHPELSMSSDYCQKKLYI